jgi:CubicO group peptidase (beta-lactamase class C family)
MKLLTKTILGLIATGSLMNAVFAQEPNIDNWEEHRAEGLAHLHRIMTNVMVVNAQDVFPLNYQARDYALHEIPSVARVMNHPAVSGLVVITDDGDVLLEHYGNGKDRNSTFSDQSATKSSGWILLNKALSESKISLDDNVEKHIPEIGPGFKGRTIGDVAAMAVHHNVAELAAYKGDPVALKMFKRSDVVFGFGRNAKQETLVEFVQTIEAGGENGSNEWKGATVNYASINTNVLALAIQRATKVPFAKQVRRLLHKAGGVNPVYMGTDFDGVPMISGDMCSSTVDFARYGRLLIEDKAQVLADRRASKSAGQVVPAELLHIESRYYKSAVHNEFGIGHSGWGGQVIWADPESGVIVAANSQLASKLPAPYPHFNMLYAAAYDIVKHQRAKKKD